MAPLKQPDTTTPAEPVTDEQSPEGDGMVDSDGLWTGTCRDVAGQCNAHLYIGDDYGDNSSTMRCQLAPGHGGEHEERFQRPGGSVVVRWEADERCYHDCAAELHDDHWYCSKCSMGEREYERKYGLQLARIDSRSAVQP